MVKPITPLVDSIIRQPLSNIARYISYFTSKNNSSVCFYRQQYLTLKLCRLTVVMDQLITTIYLFFL